MLTNILSATSFNFGTREVVVPSVGGILPVTYNNIYHNLHPKGDSSHVRTQVGSYFIRAMLHSLRKLFVSLGIVR